MTTKLDYGNLPNLEVYQWKFAQSLKKAGRIPTGGVKTNLMYVWLVSVAGAAAATQFGDDIQALFNYMLADKANQTSNDVLKNGNGWDLLTYADNDVNQPAIFSMNGKNAMLNGIELDFSKRTRYTDDEDNNAAGSSDDYLVRLEIETFGEIKLGGGNLGLIKDDTKFA